MIFSNREEAGEKIAEKLAEYKNAIDAVVLGLPRGGAVVASVVARILNLPLDIVVPRKIGAPGNPEYAIGAISEEGDFILNEEVGVVVDENYLEKTIAQEKKEAARRVLLYRGNRSELDLKGKTAILVDDGIATGSTARASIRSARNKGASKIVVAAPVVAADTAERLKKECDQCVFLDVPEFFGAVGAFYRDFHEVSDEEVIRLMEVSS